MLVGEIVELVCNGSVNQTNWLLPNHTRYNSSHYKSMVTTADSGEYRCNNKSVTLIVVERLSNVWVSSMPQSLATMEGERVTLNCRATSQPPSVNWFWTRLDEKGAWENVSTEQAVTLSTAGESGQYQCHGYSNFQNRTQMANSSIRTIIIVSFPWSGSVNSGVAGLVLALLANILLLLVILWLWRQLTSEIAASKTKKAQPKGIPGPAKASKRSQSQAKTEDVGDIYMNC
ncbi:hypothetical protein UPYG_G00229340 [Umbra pygmaea]|uniref:Ig-like domain-containing protein n=1 Tax=Umbra pygmaea TaxID=75934 RepID=A0ABD0WE06_UMBPY